MSHPKHLESDFTNSSEFLETHGHPGGLLLLEIAQGKTVPEKIQVYHIHKTEHAVQSYAAGKDYLDFNFDKKRQVPKGTKKKKRGNMSKRQKLLR